MSDSGKREPFLGRIFADQIDMLMVKGWVDKCVAWHSNEWHGDECEQLVFPRSVDPRQMNLFRVIDVVDGCLVRPAPSCMYVALSYRWGGVEGLQATVDNIGNLEASGGLRALEARIPNTIRDAMNLTTELGYRYLWVDQLCIVQDDVGNKQAAIESMTGVYAFAHLTIMAADGNDANAGLRGYGSRPRQCEQVSHSIRPGLRLLLVPDLPNMLAATPYEERAWTYQERILSRRCLIFLNGQVHFRCRRVLWREDIDLEWQRMITSKTKEGQSLCKYLDPSASPDGLMSINFKGAALEEPNSTLLDFCTSYSRLVSSVSRRRLSYQSDALNAALGILEPLALTGPEPKKLLAGIPASILDEALLWTPGPQVLSRRQMQKFPSWSWSGWIGPIEEATALFIRPDKTHTTTKRCFVWIYMPQFSVADFAAWRENPEGKQDVMGPFRSSAPSHHCYSLLDWDTIPTVPFPVPKCEADPQREHILWFWTVAFKLNCSAMVQRADQRFYSRTYSSDVVIEVRDDTGNFAGRVLCHWPGYPEVPSPAWPDLEFVVMRTCSDPDDRLLTDWLPSRLGLSGYKRNDWGVHRPAWRTHIVDKDGVAPWPDKADDPFYVLKNRSEARFFNVLLLEWQENGVAERVGIGLVLETAIRDAVAPGPVWKEIVLA